jgi:hypothetical protein
MPRKVRPMTTRNPPAGERTVFVRWLLLVALAALFMFMGSLWLFSLLPGVDAPALYAPILTHLGGMVQAVVGSIGFVVAWRGIAPAIRAYYHPTRKAERDEVERLRVERDAAKEAATLAETDLQNALGHVKAWHELISEEYRTVFPQDNTTPAPEAMLRAMRAEIVITRPALQRVESIVRERDELRTQVAALLNQPAPPKVLWQDLLPLVQYVAEQGVKVGGLRDAIRKLTPIPEGEYDRFSAAVRALPAYSPTRKGGKGSLSASVNTPPAPPAAPVHGRTRLLTDGRNPPRTRRTRPKPHAARVRCEVAL